MKPMAYISWYETSFNTTALPSLLDTSKNKKDAGKIRRGEMLAPAHEDFNAKEDGKVASHIAHRFRILACKYPLGYPKAFDVRAIYRHTLICFRRLGLDEPDTRTYVD